MKPKINLASDRPRLLYVVTSSDAVGLLRGQMSALGRAGFEVFVASSPGPELLDRAASESATPVIVPMQREMSPLQDLRSFISLYREMRRIRPTLANVSTPKAGVLGGVAAWLANVPCRIYTLRGLRWESTRGAKRWLLLAADWLACRVAHRVICVSASVRQRAIASGLVARAKAVVLGEGSSNGVDAGRFAITPVLAERVRELRSQLRIPASAPVIGFVGRLTRDKGIPELVEAHALLTKNWPELRLLLVGKMEPGDPLPIDVVRQIDNNPRIIAHRPVKDVVPFFYLMDLLALPSHREGFPNVVLEAGAAGKPVVAAKSTGIIDAVVDGVTGLLVPPCDASALANALDRVLANPELARRLGSAGRHRAQTEFSRERIWSELECQYRALLESRGLPTPSPVSRGIESHGPRAATRTGVVSL